MEVNGHRELIGVGGMFPSVAPLFKLVSFKGKQARIEVVGGSFTSGKSYMLVPQGHNLVFLNKSDGTRLKILFKKTTHADPSKVVTAPQPTSSKPGSSTTPVTTTAATTTTAG